MFLQTLATERVETRYNFRFSVDIQTNGASNLLLNVFQKRLHYDRQKRNDAIEYNKQLTPKGIELHFWENRTKSVTSSWWWPIKIEKLVCNIRLFICGVKSIFIFCLRALILNSPDGLALCQIIKSYSVSLWIFVKITQRLTAKLNEPHQFIKILMLICFIYLPIYSISIHLFSCSDNFWRFAWGAFLYSAPRI